MKITENMLKKMVREVVSRILMESIEVDHGTEKNFLPTVGWMKSRYDEMNEKLFDGRLGDCHFSIFTTGRGSQGGTLGKFQIKGNDIWIQRRDRHMYRLEPDGTKTFVNRENFFELCKPTISLNGNYYGTEYAHLSTLVHEMCHYYTNMGGYDPKQSHGNEFKHIGMLVSIRSNNLFTIQRLASAEEMEEFELNDVMKARNDKREANLKSKMNIVLTISKYHTKLVTTTSSQLVGAIESEADKNGEDFLVSNNMQAIEFLRKKGFTNNMKLLKSIYGRPYWRYWIIDSAPWLDELKVLMGEETSQPEPIKTEPIRVFVVNTSKGVFKCEGTSEEEIFQKVKERFSNLSDSTIERLVNNPANYKVSENKRSRNDIIQEVIDEFMENEGMIGNNNGDIKITPDMDLSKHSPFEIA